MIVMRTESIEQVVTSHLMLLQTPVRSKMSLTDWEYYCMVLYCSIWCVPCRTSDPSAINGSHIRMPRKGLVSSGPRSIGDVVSIKHVSKPVPNRES
jgi:hypothetical protein